MDSCGSVGLRMNIWCSDVLPFRQISDVDQPAEWILQLWKFGFPSQKTSSKTKIHRSWRLQFSLSPLSEGLHNHRSRFVSKDNKRICMKGNNFHNRRSPTCGQRHHYTPLPERQNFFISIISTSVKKEPMELKFVIGNSHFSFLTSPLLISHFSTSHFFSDKELPIIG